MAQSSSEEKRVFQLSEITGRLSELLSPSFGRRFSVRAEIARISFSKRGDCFLDLIQQDKGRTTAMMVGRLSKWKLEELQRRLGNDYQVHFASGAVNVFDAHITFHEVFGLSMQIEDLNIVAMMGELERRRRETIRRLEELGVIDRNKTIVLPSVIQNLALICSPASEARFDFLDQLNRNPFGFNFSSEELSSSVQGDQARTELLQSVREAQSLNCDAIVIVRGGGSPLDLDCFNDYNLCLEISESTVPVFTGIGHNRDATVADYVAHTDFKTPTAVADFIIDHNRTFERAVIETFSSLNERVRKIVNQEDRTLTRFRQLLISKPLSTCRIQAGSLLEMKGRIERLSRKASSTQNARMDSFTQTIATVVRRRVSHDLPRELQVVSLRVLEKAISIVRQRIKDSEHSLNRISDRVESRMRTEIRQMDSHTTRLALVPAQIVDRETGRVEDRLKTIELVSPKRTLRRGFSITRLNGEAVKSSIHLQTGDKLETTLANGIVSSTVQETKKDYG